MDVADQRGSSGGDVRRMKIVGKDGKTGARGSLEPFYKRGFYRIIGNIAFLGSQPIFPRES